MEEVPSWVPSQIDWNQPHLTSGLPEMRAAAPFFDDSRNPMMLRSRTEIESCSPTSTSSTQASSTPSSGAPRPHRATTRNAPPATPQ